MEYTIKAKDGRIFTQIKVETGFRDYTREETLEELQKRVFNYETREREKSEKEYKKLVVAQTTAYNMSVFWSSEEDCVDIVRIESLEDVNRLKNAVLWASYYKDALENASKITSKYIGEEVIVYMGYDYDCYTVMGTVDEIANNQKTQMHEEIRRAKERKETGE